MNRPQCPTRDQAGLLAVFGSREMDEARRAVHEYRAFEPDGDEMAEMWRQHAARGNSALLKLTDAVEREAADLPVPFELTKRGAAVAALPDVHPREADVVTRADQGQAGCWSAAGPRREPRRVPTSLSRRHRATRGRCGRDGRS